MKGRLALGAAGVAIAGWGAWLLLTSPSTQPPETLAWLVGLVVVHDAVLAPLAVFVGWLVGTTVPAAARAVVLAAAFAMLCAALVALPLLLAPSPAPDPSSRPLPYGRNVVGVLLVTALGGGAGAWLAVQRDKRRR